MLELVSMLLLSGASSASGEGGALGSEPSRPLTSATLESPETWAPDGAPRWAMAMALEEPLLWEEPLARADRSAGDASDEKETSLDMLQQKDTAGAQFVVNAGLHGRWSLPFGAAEHTSFTYGGVVYVSRYLSWSDLFEPGWGYDIEVDVYFGEKRQVASGFNGGLVILLQSDTYTGGRATNSFGGNLTFGDLTMGSLLVGGTVIQTIGQGFYTKGLIAIGPVHYSAVDTTFSGFGFTTFQAESFRSTWTISSDFRADLGYRAGPLGIVFGVGFRIQAPPEEAGATVLNSGAFWTFDLNLGLELGFLES